MIIVRMISVFLILDYILNIRLEFKKSGSFYVTDLVETLKNQSLKFSYDMNGNYSFIYPNTNLSYKPQNYLNKTAEYQLSPVYKIQGMLINDIFKFPDLRQNFTMTMILTGNETTFSSTDLNGVLNFQLNKYNQKSYSFLNDIMKSKFKINGKIIQIYNETLDCFYLYVNEIPLILLNNDYVYSRCENRESNSVFSGCPISHLFFPEIHSSLEDMINLGQTQVQFSFLLDHIYVPILIYNEYIKNTFFESLLGTICFEKTIKDTLLSIYCKIDEKELNSKFKSIGFVIDEVGYFLNPNQLFSKIDEYYEFNLYFDLTAKNSSNWILGRSFFKRFPIEIDQKKSMIGFLGGNKIFYSKSTTFLVLVIILNSVILIMIVSLILKSKFNLNKKKK